MERSPAARAIGRKTGQGMVGEREREEETEVLWCVNLLRCISAPLKIDLELSIIHLQKSLDKCLKLKAAHVFSISS